MMAETSLTVCQYAGTQLPAGTGQWREYSELGWRIGPEFLLPVGKQLLGLGPVPWAMTSSRRKTVELYSQPVTWSRVGGSDHYAGPSCDRRCAYVLRPAGRSL
jgi:hypothetical protein